MNGSSFNVEVGSSMEKVDDSSLQDGNRSIKVTPRKPSQVSIQPPVGDIGYSKKVHLDLLYIYSL